MAYRLEPGETLAHGLRRVALEQAQAAGEHLRAARKDPKTAIHEARKRSKEARAALRLMRAVADPLAVRAARAAFRDAARLIAEPRDAEVALGTLAALRKAGPLLRSERIPAEAALAARRSAALRRVTKPGVAAVAAAFAAAAATVPATPEAESPGVESPGVESPEAAAALAGELARIYRRGRRGMRQAYAEGLGEHERAEAFHRWRHEAKDLWYALRLLEPAWPGPLGALVAELHEVASLLGDEHDLTVLRLSLSGEARGEPPLLTARFARAIGRRQAALRARLRPLGARLWAEPPRAFGTRIAVAWEVWRA